MGVLPVYWRIFECHYRFPKSTITSPLRMPWPKDALSSLPSTSQTTSKIKSRILSPASRLSQPLTVFAFHLALLIGLFFLSKKSSPAWAALELLFFHSRWLQDTNILYPLHRILIVLNLEVLEELGIQEKIGEPQQLPNPGEAVAEPAQAPKQNNNNAASASNFYGNKPQGGGLAQGAQRQQPKL